MSRKSLGIFSLFVFIILLSSSIFSVGKDALQTNRSADAAIFEQVIENIHVGNGPVSDVFASTQNFIDRGYFSLSLSKRLEGPLARPDTPARDMMRFHAYWLLYTIAPFLAFLSSSLLLTTIQTLAYASLLCGVFLVILRESGRIWSALIAVAVVLASPVFFGGLVGQFYPDRLFVALGFFLCALVYFRANIWWILIAAILTGLLNERAALIGGGVMMIIPFCRCNRPFVLKEILLPIAIGAMLVLYSVAIGKLWITNLYYGSYLPSGVTDLYNRFLLPDFANNALQLLLANSLLLVLALGNWRLALVAVLVLVPNVIGNIGGAEKTGWLTHYHSYYFPVLVFAATVGFIAIGERVGGKRHLAVAVIALLLATPLLKREIALNRLPHTDYVMMVYKVFGEKRDGKPTGYDLRREIISLVPKDSLVVTDEMGMAMLMGHTRLDYFPISASAADYLFLSCSLVSSDVAGLTNDSVPTQWLLDHGFSASPSRKLPSVDRCLYSRL